MQNKIITSGFTLIELIIGTVILSISFIVFFQMILPSATQSANQIHQVRAAELGQAIMREIMGKAFDENSEMVGGVMRCGEDMDGDGDRDPCSNNLTFDEDETNAVDEGVRSLFDDVDDYNGYSTIEHSFNHSGASLSDIYRGFTLQVSVIYDSNYDGVADIVNTNDTDVSAKLITVTVTSAEGFSVTFASYKANF